MFHTSSVDSTRLQTQMIGDFVFITEYQDCFFFFYMVQVFIYFSRFLSDSLILIFRTIFGVLTSLLVLDIEEDK